MKVTVKRTERVTVEIEVNEGFYSLKTDGGFPKAMAYNGGKMAMLVVAEQTGISTSIGISFLDSLLGVYEIEKEITEAEFMAFMHTATEAFQTFFPKS